MLKWVIRRRLASAAAQLQAMLTPEQQARFTEIAATANERIQARRARNVSNPGSSIQTGQIPVLGLDKLDQSVAAVQKMTEAAKLMMEGMKGLSKCHYLHNDECAHSR